MTGRAPGGAMRALAILGALATCVAATTARAYAQASVTTGSVRGQIRDRATGAPVEAATVIVESPALQAEQSALTDSRGLYFVTALPPGDYKIIVYADEATFTRDNVVIQVGKEVVLNIAIDSGAVAGRPAGETILIRGAAPVIDQGSTKTGVSITRDFTDNVPVGRTFLAVMGAAAGAQSDFYGTSLSGATSIENTYIIEGLNTTDTARGGVSSNLPNEFIAETEVIAGGYSAEYGRATGGIVNVVTKQGSNEFHGSVFGYYTPGSLSAAARAIQKEGGSVATQSNLDYAYDVGAEVGGPIVPDRLWFHVGFNPSRRRTLLTRSVEQQVDKDQDGVPDADPDSGVTLRDRVTSRDVPSATTTYYFTTKLTGQLAPEHQVQLAAFGNPRAGNSSSYDLPYPETWAPTNLLIDREDGAYDGTAKYTGKLNNHATQIDASIGYHHGYNRMTPGTAAGAQPQTDYDYTRSLFDFVDLEGPGIGACQDGGAGDLYPLIQNCPVNLYGEQGLGILERRTNDRWAGQLTITHRVRALGTHVLKAGLDVESASYDTTLAWTGGQQLRRSCNTDDNGVCSEAPDAKPGAWLVLGYMRVIRNLTAAELADPSQVALEPGQQIDGCLGGRAICGPADERVVSTNNRSYAAYAQDSWQVLPNLTLNLGLRYERQVLNNADVVQGALQPTGERVPTTAFTLDNWAPRLGVIYDPTSDGASKLFAHWGRFFENIPNDLNVRAFGGEIISISHANSNQRRPGDAGYNASCGADHQAGSNPATVLAGCDDRDPSAFLLGGATEYVAPNLRGQHTDEIVLGAELQLVADFKLAATYTHRTVPTVIEDVSANNASDYLIVNPGANYDAAAAALRAEAAKILATDPVRAAALESRADWLALTKRFDPPTRNYDALTLRVEQRPTKRSLLIASYTYARERGNYPGLFSTETNQLDPNSTTQYDLPDLLANRYGPLGLDRPHSAKLDGFYLFDLARAGRLTLGASARLQSGIAHNALAAHPVYGLGESYLLPRGSVARSPMTHTVDAHVAYGRALSDGRVVEVFVNVFNAFDEQAELNVDENYTFDSALPIVGGDASDLEHAKATEFTATGKPVTVNRSLVKNRNFDHTSAVGAPRSFQFGARVSF